MKRIQMLLVLIPIIQAVKVKVARDNEKSIVNINSNKGPVLYPSAAKQTMVTTSSTTSTTTTHTPPNNTYVYQKGFLPIPMATLETTTTRQQQERRTGFSTVSQEIDEQIPPTPQAKLPHYEISEHQDSYEDIYKGHSPISHTPLFYPEPTEKTPPYKFETVGTGIENQLEHNEIHGYGDFKGYQLPDHHFPEHHMQEHHIPEHHMQEHHIPKTEHKEPPQQESFLGAMFGILSAIIPLGLIISAFQPNYIVVNPNATAV